MLQHDGILVDVLTLVVAARRYAEIEGAQPFELHLVAVLHQFTDAVGSTGDDTGDDIIGVDGAVLGDVGGQLADVQGLQVPGAQVPLAVSLLVLAVVVLILLQIEFSHNG